MSKKRNQPEMLNELIGGLTQAIGAAGQVVHQHQDPRFLEIRSSLELAKQGCIGLATFAATKSFAVRPA